MLIWVDTVACLRAVGHELEKDAESDTRLKQAHRGWLNTRKKPNPPIFWDFILKEADVELSFEFSGGSHAPQPPPPAPTSPPIHTYQMASGRFAGQDTRDLVREAIEWWEKQLDAIERKAAASPP
jgi:hypothetical protein